MGELTGEIPGPRPDDQLARLLAEHHSWLAVERSLAVSSLAAYRRDLRAYEAFLRQRRLEAAQIGERTVAAYLDHLRQLKTPEGSPRLAPSSIARALVAVRSFHRFCLHEGHLAGDPTEVLGVPRVPRGIPKALSEAEVSALLVPPAGDGPIELRDQAVLELLYGTGARISELVSLDRSGLDLGERFIRVLGKGGKERVVPVGRTAVSAVSAYLDRARPTLAGHARRSQTAAIFLNARGGRLSRQGCWHLVARRGRIAGLGDRLHPHVLRHSFATHLLDRGADIRVVQELLGHSRVTTTQIYTKVSNERLRAVYDAAHPRARSRPRAGGPGG